MRQRGQPTQILLPLWSVNSNFKTAHSAFETAHSAFETADSAFEETPPCIYDGRSIPNEMDL